jgi:hypothetical protein
MPRTFTQNDLPRLKDNYGRGDMPSASDLNAVMKLLNNAQAHDGIWMRLGSGGLHIGGGASGGSGFPWHKVAFGWSLADNVVTIRAGVLHIHSIGKVNFPETAVTLLAETCTVYAQCARGSYADGQILVSAAPPATSNTHYRFPLATFSYNEETDNYAMETIHHFGDLHLDTPLM